VSFAGKANLLPLLQMMLEDRFEISDPGKQDFPSTAEAFQGMGKN